MSNKQIKYILLLVISLMIGLIYISYDPVKQTNWFGNIGHAIAHLSINNLWGITAFFFPIAGLYIGYLGMRRKINLTSLFWQLIFGFLSFFAINLFLLNTSLIHTAYAGMFGMVFHALILNVFSPSKSASASSFIIESMLASTCLVSTYWSFYKVFAQQQKHQRMRRFQIAFLKHCSTVLQKCLHSFKTIPSSTLIDKNQISTSLFEEFPFMAKVMQNERGIFFKHQPKQTNPPPTETTNPPDKNNNNTSKNNQMIPGSMIAQALSSHQKLETTSVTHPHPKNETTNPLPIKRYAPTEGILLNETVVKKDETNNLPFVFPKTDTSSTHSSNHLYDIDLSDSSILSGTNTSLSTPPSHTTTTSSPVPDSDPETTVQQEQHVLHNLKKKPTVFNSSHPSAEDQNFKASLQSLSTNSSQVKEIPDNVINDTIKTLEETIQQFGIQTKVVAVSIGPVITQYELTVEPGVKISRIVNLSDNIALALAAPSIRIIAPIPGKSVIGIEVPNQSRQMVSLKDVVTQKRFQQAKEILPVALGKSIFGQPVITDLTLTPHLLIAGATGSGKSVCVNAIICSLLIKCLPSALRFLMIDPKMVELNVYNGIPHLLCPVITNPKKAASSLRWIHNEMESRYHLLEKYGVRNIHSYNNIIQEKQASSLIGTLPYIVVVIDEFSDLMMVARKDVEDSISRLASMSRAVGIHLILATQRPSVDVITGVIKANFPSRIAFQVSSKIDSRTILDASGAEKLLGKGDMLFQSVHHYTSERIQGNYLSDKEVNDIAGELRLKAQQHPSYQVLLDIPDDDDKTKEKPLIDDVNDELYEEVLQIIQQEKKISASFLQRRLKIGYNRAARIVEIMEERGIVGPADGSKPREVYI